MNSVSLRLHHLLTLLTLSSVHLVAAQTPRQPPVGPVATGQHVVVVLDNSGSMNESIGNNRRTNRMQAAKRALTMVIQSLPADTQIGIVTLNPPSLARRENNRWIVPLGPLDKQEAIQSIQTLQARGATPLGTYMKIGADDLIRARAHDHYGTYRLLVVTDGEANDKHLVERYLPDIMGRGIQVDVIGVNLRARHSLATKVHTYRNANDPESLTKAIQEVFAETDNQPSDAGSNDFDLIAGLPDDVATAVVASLSDIENRPIGSVKSGANADGEPDGPARQATGNPQNQPTASQPVMPNKPRRRGRSRGSFFIILFVAFTLINILKAVFKNRRRNSY